MKSDILKTLILLKFKCRSGHAQFNCTRGQHDNSNVGTAEYLKQSQIREMSRLRENYH